MNLSGVLDKIGLYILSMSLLFLFIIILSFKIPNFQGIDSYWLIIYEIVYKNKISLFSLFFILVGLIFYIRFKKHSRFSSLDSFKIKACKSEDYEQLTFLSTYIAPFLGFSFDNIQNNIAYFLLIAVIGSIIIKTNKYYANPTLALFNYKLYKIKYVHASTRESKEITVISIDKLKVGDIVNYRFLDETFCIVRKR